jgi:hypothetical protein
MMTTLISAAVVAAIAVAAWFATNFLGQPILALRAKRLEAMQIAEKYLYVNHACSENLCRTARTSLHDVGNALLAYSREASFATRLWCRLWKYDLDFAAHCLFGLAEGASGKYNIS